MPVNTYDHIFTKGPESALPNTFDEGKIRFTTDTGRLFVDGQNNRTEVSDFVKGMTEDEIKSQLAPLVNKIYISSDTNKFMIYDSSITGNWINIANSGQAQHADDADEATHASTADYAINSGTATYATNAGTSTYATNAGTSVEANHAVNAGTSTYATNAGTAVHASTSDYATNAGTAAYVTNGVRSIVSGTANGTINVNINGSTSDVAVKGLGDRAFDSTTYLPLAGGNMTGQIKLAATGFRTNNDGGYKIDEYGNFTALNASSGAYLGFYVTENQNRVKLFWESGNIETAGSVKIGGGCTLQYNANTQSLDFIFA